jgi:hypothetical protein
LGTGHMLMKEENVVPALLNLMADMTSWLAHHSLKMNLLKTGHAQCLEIYF